MPSLGECISTSNSQDPCSASSLAELFCTKNYDRITPTRMCSLAPRSRQVCLGDLAQIICITFIIQVVQAI